MVNDITITKQHSNERRNGVYQKYKYIITLQGEYAPGKNSLYFEIDYYNNKNCEIRGYKLNTGGNTVIESYTVDENNKFTLVISQYNMNVDYDSFSIRNFSASYSMSFDANWEDGSTINISDLSDSNYDSFSITRYHFNDYVDGEFYRFKYDFNVSGTASSNARRVDIYCYVLGYVNEDGESRSVGERFTPTDLNLDENNKYSKSFTVYSDVNIDGDLSVTY